MVYLCERESRYYPSQSAHTEISEDSDEYMDTLSHTDTPRYMPCLYHRWSEYSTDSYGRVTSITGYRDRVRYITLDAG